MTPRPFCAGICPPSAYHRGSHRVRQRQRQRQTEADRGRQRQTEADRGRDSDSDLAVLSNCDGGGAIGEEGGQRARTAVVVKKHWIVHRHARVRPRVPDDFAHPVA